MKSKHVNLLKLQKSKKKEEKLKKEKKNERKQLRPVNITQNIARTNLTKLLLYFYTSLMHNLMPILLQLIGYFVTY